MDPGTNDNDQYMFDDDGMNELTLALRPYHSPKEPKDRCSSILTDDQFKKINDLNDKIAIIQQNIDEIEKQMTDLSTPTPEYIEYTTDLLCRLQSLTEKERADAHGPKVYTDEELQHRLAWLKNPDNTIVTDGTLKMVETWAQPILEAVLQYLPFVIPVKVTGPVAVMKDATEHPEPPDYSSDVGRDIPTYTFRQLEYLFKPIRDTQHDPRYMLQIAPTSRSDVLSGLSGLLKLLFPFFRDPTNKKSLTSVMNLLTKSKKSTTSAHYHILSYLEEYRQTPERGNALQQKALGVLKAAIVTQNESNPMSTTMSREGMTFTSSYTLPSTSVKEVCKLIQ
jgi:hypothetical protein